MKLLVLDNYDSFTYNLVHMLRELAGRDQVTVVRNDKMGLDQVAAYDKILLSPGPGIPSEAGMMPELISHYGSSKSILGVCLGHQAIAEAYGGAIYNMPQVLHGIGTQVDLQPGEGLFSGMPSRILAARYHSWAVVKDSLGTDLRVTATAEDGEIMGLRHSSHDVAGLQFHPESIITEQGKTIINNWLKA